MGQVNDAAAAHDSVSGGRVVRRTASDEARASDSVVAVTVVSGPPGAATHVTEAFLKQLEELGTSEDVLVTLRKDVAEDMEGQTA
jgi:hypothetical protein